MTLLLLLLACGPIFFNNAQGHPTGSAYTTAPITRYSDAQGHYDGSSTQIGPITNFYDSTGQHTGSAIQVQPSDEQPQTVVEPPAENSQSVDP